MTQIPQPRLFRSGEDGSAVVKRGRKGEKRSGCTEWRRVDRRKR